MRDEEHILDSPQAGNLTFVFDFDFLDQRARDLSTARIFETARRSATSVIVLLLHLFAEETAPGNLFQLVLGSAQGTSIGQYGLSSVPISTNLEVGEELDWEATYFQVFELRFPKT